MNMAQSNDCVSSLSLGVPPRIPAKSTILAEIEVINVVDSGDADAYIHLPMSQRKDAPFDMCLQAVIDIKKQGNALFKQKQYEQVSS